MREAPRTTREAREEGKPAGRAPEETVAGGEKLWHGGGAPPVVRFFGHRVPQQVEAAQIRQRRKRVQILGRCAQIRSGREEGRTVLWSAPLQSHTEGRAERRAGLPRRGLGEGEGRREGGGARREVGQLVV